MAFIELTTLLSNSRVQAAAICQALVDGGYIESLTEPFTFIDGYSLYRPGTVSVLEETSGKSDDFESTNLEEPSWIQSVPQESSSSTNGTLLIDSK